MKHEDFSITIEGRIGGKIWMPAVLCWKDFDYTVKKDDTLRNAILHIINDGDFQSCEIAEGTIAVTYWKTSRRITRYFDLRLPMFSSITDCLMMADSDDYNNVMYPEYEEAQ